ncbi:ATP-binding protein [Escherichia coli]|nr:ATP-binding protein [Escherichia coli]
MLVGRHLKIYFVFRLQQNAFLHTGLHMRLRKLKLKNFRGYRNSTEIIIDESMTGIVGRNDFGKSTLLEALAIFLKQKE